MHELIGTACLPASSAMLLLLLSAIAVLLLLLSAVAAIAVARHHAGPPYTTSCNFTSAWLRLLHQFEHHNSNHKCRLPSQTFAHNF